LPEDADYEMHEDYIEWHYWPRVREKTQNTLDVLMSVSKKGTNRAIIMLVSSRYLPLIGVNPFATLFDGKAHML